MKSLRRSSALRQCFAESHHNADRLDVGILSSAMCAAPIEWGALMHGPKFCAGFRGGLTEEASAAIDVLRAYWPAAFPQSPNLIRPLGNDMVATIAERTGWSKRY